MVAGDGLQIVQSRTATLDVFVSTFILAGALLVHMAHRPPSASRSSRTWYLAAAGVMFGAGVAVKWAALPALVLAAVAFLAVSANRKETLSVIGLLGFVPLVVYVLSYARFWDQNGVNLVEWLRLQQAMLRFHLGVVAGHPYASSAVGWLLLRRPVTYFFVERGDRVQHIVALGNPLLWWAFVAALPSLVRAWLRRNDQAADVILLGFAATYLPWLLVRRTSFLYYLTPLVPFMAVGVAWAMQRLWRSSPPRALRRSSVVTYLIAMLGAVAVFLPVWIGLPIGYAHWQRLMLFPGWV